MARGKLSEEDELGIVEWYERGESTRKVGRRFGISKTTVREVLKKRSVQARAKNEPWKLLKSEQEEVLRRYLSGEGSTTIAKDYPVSSSMIQKLMRRKGVLRVFSEVERSRRELESVKRYLQGEKVRRIAGDISISRKTVERYVKMAGVPFRRGRLTEAQEEEIVERYQSGEISSRIAEGLPVSRTAVLRTLHRRNVPTRGGAIDFSKADEQEIIKLYEAGRSINFLGKRFHVDRSTIESLLKKKGIPIRTLSEAQRKYSMNENFFEEINSEAKAYWLGFLMADGHVSRRNEVILKLAKKDAGHLVKYRNYLGSNHPIRGINTFLRSTGRTYPMAQVTLISPKLADDLKQWGVIPSKTSNEIFPQIECQYANHFIRGVFDGDGSISKSQFYICCSANEFLNSIQERLSSSGLSQAGTDKHPSADVHYLRYFGKDNMRRIYSYLYSDATVWLDRKKEKFEEILFGGKLVDESDPKRNGVVPLDQF